MAYSYLGKISDINLSLSLIANFHCMSTWISKVQQVNSVSEILKIL